MEHINTNFERLFADFNQVNSNAVQSNFAKIPNFNFTDNGAFIPEMDTTFSKYDFTMEQFAIFKEYVTVANDGLEQMKNHGESIRDLITKAKEEGCTPESIDAIQKEVNSRINEIHNLRQNTDFNGINPFKSPFSLEIPFWQDFFGSNSIETTEQVEEKEGEKNKNEITDLIASFDINMNINGDSDGAKFGMGAKATINIGYTDDGSLQITVDATMDFDLSGIKNDGVTSDSALDIINNFLNLITGKQNGLNNASNMFDAFMAKGTASIIGDGFAIEATNDITMDKDSSETIKGQIVQHASITLDSTANQCPSIAINLL